jgi:hypothetical protein
MQVVAEDLDLQVEQVAVEVVALEAAELQLQELQTLVVAVEVETAQALTAVQALSLFGMRYRENN